MSDQPSPLASENAPELSEAQFAEFAEGLLEEPKRQPRQRAQQNGSQRASDAPPAEQPGQPDPVPGPEDPAPSDDEEELPDEPDEAADEADDSDHQGEIDPPNSWSNADKELFRALPPEAQAVIARRESEQNRAFHQKTQEIAEHRKALESTFQAVGQERQRYETNLEQLMAVALPEVQRFQGIDWQRLASEQPAEYVRMSAERDALRGRIGAIQQELAGVRQQMQQAEAYQFLERKQEEAHQLVAKLPEFADPQRGPRKIAEMKQFLSEQGFSPQEIGQAIDHRLLVVADMAMQFKRMQTVRRQAESKQSGRAPTVQRPGSARQGSDSRASQRRQEKMAALSRSGSEKDAMSYFMEVLDR